MSTWKQAEFKFHKGEDMQKFFVLVVLLGLLAIPMMASDTPRVAVFGGWQYQHFGGDLSDLGNVPKGFDFSVTGNLNKHIGVTGDFGGSFKSVDGFSGHLYTYSGGPVIQGDAGGRINPFVHFLFGGFTIGGSIVDVGGGSTNGYTMMPGGGVDAKIAKSVAIRVIQFDWVYLHANGVGEKSNVRLASGVVFRF
jgi:hypothetical protein